MNSEEITGLADGFVDAILAAKVTRAECIMLLAVIQAKLYQKILPQEQEVIQVKLVEPKPLEVDVPKRKKEVQYDMFDPPPPFEPEPVPPRTTTAKLLAPKNFACFCESCSKVVYTTNRDIFSTDGLEQFRKSFTPMSGAPELAKTTRISNLDGNITTDCTLCGAPNRLYLTGKPTPGVVSI